MPNAAFADPLDEWKREALSSVGTTKLGPQDGPGLSLRVQVGFVLLVIVAGAPLGVVGWAATLVTLLSVFLVQELPTALWARIAGRGACVVLSERGSDTQVSGAPLATIKAFALSASGSIGNFGVALGLWQLLHNTRVASATSLIDAAIVVHVLWGLSQGLPLAPFRAGRAIARRLRPPMRFAYAALSLVCIAVVNLWLLRPPVLPAYFSIFVLATTAAMRALRDAFNELRDEQAGVVLLSAAAAGQLRHDEPERAAELARRGLAAVSVEANRLPLLTTLAWAAIAKRDPCTAHGALLQLGAGSRDLHLVAAYLACCNRVGEAIELLQKARSSGHRARETSKLLVDLLFQSSQQAEALAVATSDCELLHADDLRAIKAAFGDVSNTRGVSAALVGY